VSTAFEVHLSFRWPATLLLFFACSCRNSVLDSCECEESDVDTDSDTDVGGDSSPWVESASAVCHFESSEGGYFQWETACLADDPQGAATLREYSPANSFVMVIDSSSTIVAGYALVCFETGRCTTSFKETDDGVLCSDAATYTFRFQVADEHGNISAPYEVAGTQQ